MAISGDERRRRTGLSAHQRSRENKRRNEEAKKMDRILQNGCRFLLGGSSLKMAVSSIRAKPESSFSIRF